MELWTSDGRKIGLRHLLPTFVVLFLIVDFSHTGPLIPDSSCDLSNCWELYQSAQESLRISDDYPITKHRAASAPPDELRQRCITLRTFFFCLRNMSRACLGDLNFHSAHKGIEKQMKQYNCNITGPVFELSSPNRQAHPTVCSYEGPKASYGLCSLFGDPHLRTFAGSFHTCKLHGAWPLIDNEYLTVQVTNERVGVGEGTAITKVTVILKEQDECALDHYVSYQAMSGDLPSTFDDGQTSFGRLDSVQIREIEANSHVEIYIRYIDTTVVIRQINRYFFVLLRMPLDVINETLQLNINPLQLCLMKCPASEQIDVSTVLTSNQPRLPQPILTFDESLAICQGLVDYYMDSCIYDVMMTGNTDMSLMSRLALNDTLALAPDARTFPRNRTLKLVTSGATRAICDLKWLTCYVAILILFHLKFSRSNLTFIKI